MRWTLCVCVCARAHARVRACARAHARVRACARACVRACVRACEPMFSPSFPGYRYFELGAWDLRVSVSSFPGTPFLSRSPSTVWIRVGVWSVPVSILDCVTISELQICFFCVKKWHNTFTSLYVILCTALGSQTNLYITLFFLYLKPSIFVFLHLILVGTPWSLMRFWNTSLILVVPSLLYDFYYLIDAE